VMRNAVAVAAAALMTLTAGCSAGLGGPASSRAARDGVIRFTFAPDPIWDYMNETGIVDEWQRESGYSIETSATWDEFGLFAGGHADIISTASFEVPGLEEQTQRETVIIGRYNAERSRILVRADDPAQTLADLKGKRLGVFTTVSGTLVWSALLKQMHDVNLADDYQVIVADIQNLSNLLARGEIDACICYPDLSAGDLRERSVRPLYDGKSSAELFAELDAPGHDGPMGNVFVARKDWVDGHPGEVSAFLDLWERGLGEWQRHRDDMIERYPQHFAVETPEDIAFMKDYVAQHDWVVDDVRFDQKWAEDESSIFDLMRETGVIGDDVTDPQFLPTRGVHQ
jgi:ABC-type nitrate/sulfonate/bicarbonate transport system substrate-binding protein